MASTWVARTTPTTPDTLDDVSNEIMVMVKYTEAWGTTMTFGILRSRESRPTTAVYMSMNHKGGTPMDQCHGGPIFEPERFGPLPMPNDIESLRAYVQRFLDA